MNFTPLTEEDLKSEKAKQLANIYRFMDSVYDESKKETKLSYKDSVEVNNAVIKSIDTFKEILLKNLVESVGFFKMECFLVNLLMLMKLESQQLMKLMNNAGNMWKQGA